MPNLSEVDGFAVEQENLKGRLRDICRDLRPELNPTELGAGDLYVKRLDVWEVYEDFLQWFSAAKWSPPQHESTVALYAQALALSCTEDYVVNGRFRGVDLDAEVPLVSMVVCSAIQHRLQAIGSDMPPWPQFLFSDALAKTLIRKRLLMEDDAKRPTWLLIDVINTSPTSARRGVTPILEEVLSTPLPKKVIVRVEPPPPGSDAVVDFSIHWLNSDEVEVDRDEHV